jgi:hypothetical protein
MSELLRTDFVVDIAHVAVILTKDKVVEMFVARF